MSGDCMRFPDTVEEFMEQYKVVDKEGIYMSKGAKLVPIFRMEQWFEHEKAQLSQEGTTKGTTTDTISRQAAIDECNKRGAEHIGYAIAHLPSAQPTATWLIHKWGDDAKCSNCGRSFKDVYDMDNYDQYCRHCGTHMEGVTTT